MRPRYLVTAVTRCYNRNMGWNAERNSVRRNCGEGPVFCEGVPVRLAVGCDQPVTDFALAPSIRRFGTIWSSASDGAPHRVAAAFAHTRRGSEVRFRKLGRTDIDVSVVCCGTMAMSGAGTYGEQDDDVSVQMVHAALDAGITFFDTAEMYGQGHSEEVLGRALAGRRSEVVVASKVSPEHLRPDDLIAACEASLQRLRMDYMDLYQVHWPNRDVPFGETLAVLERLVQQGKIRCWGVSNFGRQDLAEALQVGHPEVNQLPYSMLWRAIEHDVVPICWDANISVLCYSPMAQGLLTGKFATPGDVPPQRRRPRYCWDAVIDLSFRVVAELRAVSEDIGAAMADVALAWLLARPGVTCVIAGMRTAEQARVNAQAADLVLSQDIVDRLDAASRPLRDALDANPDMWQADDSRYR